MNHSPTLFSGDRKRHRLAILMAILGCPVMLNCMGCGSASDDRPARVPVKGVILLNDSPLDGATVIFQPVSHTHAAVGLTDKNGQFELKTFDPQDGAVPGEFKISVFKPDAPQGAAPLGDDAPVADKAPKSLVPGKYTDANTSGLTATVAAGGVNEFKFELTGKPSEAPASQATPARRTLE